MKSSSLIRKNLSNIELLLCLLDKGQQIQGREQIDGVVSIGEEVGLPLKYKFYYHPPIGPVSPELHDDVNSMIQSGIIKFSPSTWEALAEGETVTYCLTKAGISISKKIQKNAGKGDLMFLNKVSKLFRTERRIIMALSTFFYCQRNGFDYLKLNDISRIYHLNRVQKQNVERLCKEYSQKK